MTTPRHGRSWSKRFLRSVSMVAGATALSQGANVAAAPLLTRLYNPDDFGTLAVFVSVLTLLVTVGGLRYELAIPISKTKEEASQLLVLSLAFVIIAAIALTIGQAAAGHALTTWTDTPQLSAYLWLLPIGYVFAAAYQSLSFLVVRIRAYNVIASTKLWQGLGQLSVQVGVGFTVAGPFGLLLGHSVGLGAGITRLLRALQEQFEWDSAFDLSSLKATAIAYRRYPIFMSSASLLNAAGVQAPALLIAAYFDAASAGLYFLTQKILGLPIQLVGGAVKTVFLGEGAEAARQNPEQLTQTFWRVSGILLAVGALPAAAIATVGPTLFGWVFGAEWTESGDFARYLAGAYLLKLAIDSPINLTLVNREGLALVWSVTRLGLVCGAIMGSAEAGLDASTAVAYLATALAFSYVLKLAFWLYGLRHTTTD